MMGYRVFNFRFHPPTWVGFTNFINQVQLSLFSSCLFRQDYFMPGGSTHLMCSFAGLQKPENKKVKNESNKGNPYAGTNNYHLVKHCQAAVCLSA